MLLVDWFIIQRKRNTRGQGSPADLRLEGPRTEQNTGRQKEEWLLTCDMDTCAGPGVSWSVGMYCDGSDLSVLDNECNMDPDRSLLVVAGLVKTVHHILMAALNGWLREEEERKLDLPQFCATNHVT